MDSERVPQFVHRKMFDDPTPNGLINLRYVHHFFGMLDSTTLNEEEREQFFRILLLTAKKLVSVWKHAREYERLEDSLLKEVTERTTDPASSVITIETSQDLFLEFDEFLVQLKSCLDYLVKIPIPIFGRKTWNLRTFANKGENVMKVLRRNVGQAHKAQVDGIQKVLFDQSKAWLQATIDARDKINHYVDGGISFEHFSIYRHPETGTIHKPMWSDDQSVRQFIDVSWNNLFRFGEDFTALMLYFRHKPELTYFHGPATMDSVTSPWIVTSVDTFTNMTAQPGWTPVGD